MLVNATLEAPAALSVIRNRSPSVDSYKPRFDGRSAEDWLAEAERFERMAVQFRASPELSGNFRDLAAVARGKASQVRGA